MTAISEADLGRVLLIYQTKSYQSLLNEDVYEFQNLVSVNSERAGSTAESYTYQRLTALGHDSVREVDPGGASKEFFSGDSSVLDRITVKMKETQTAVEVRQDVWKRAQLSYKDAATALDPLKLELHNKNIITLQRKEKTYHGDGTGVLAENSAAATISGGTAILSLYNQEGKRGFVRWLEFNDKVQLRDPDGTQRVPSVSSGTFSYFRVFARTELVVAGTAPTVTLKAYDSSDTELTITAFASAADGDYLFPDHQPAVDLSGAIADYAEITNVEPGLISISAEDGRVVDGVTMSGVSAGTHQDAGGATFWHTQFSELLSKLKLRSGEHKYKFPTIKMSPEVFDFIVTLNEGQRFLTDIKEAEHGMMGYYYTHRDTLSKLQVSRYCPSYRMYFEPQNKKLDGSVDVSKDAPLRFVFSDFDFITRPDNGKIWDWKVDSTAGRLQIMQAHMQGFCRFIAPQASAIGVLKNYSLS